MTCVEFSIQNPHQKVSACPDFRRKFVPTNLQTPVREYRESILGFRDTNVNSHALCNSRNSLYCRLHRPCNESAKWYGHKLFILSNHGLGHCTHVEFSLGRPLQSAARYIAFSAAQMHSLQVYIFACIFTDLIRVYGITHKIYGVSSAIHRKFMKKQAINFPKIVRSCELMGTSNFHGNDEIRKMAQFEALVLKLQA